MTLIELKALVYDISAQIQNLQGQIQAINAEIVTKSKPAPEK